MYNLEHTEIDVDSDELGELSDDEAGDMSGGWAGMGVGHRVRAGTVLGNFPPGQFPMDSSPLDSSSPGISHPKKLPN